MTKPKKNNISQKRLQLNLQTRLKKILGSNLENPMVRAVHIWSSVKEQIKTVLGPEVYNQWFHDVRAIVITDNSLILQTRNSFHTYWLTTHYQKLIDTLIHVHDAEINSFLICENDRVIKPSEEKLRFDNK